MSAPVRGIPRELSIEDFLRWLDGRPETERWELIDGEPVRSMAPGTVRHVELKRNLLEALRGGLQASGLPCRAFGDGLAVRTGKRSFFQPDAAVSCARRIDLDAIEVPDPVIVVEVLSAGTRARDQTVKLVEYFAVPSVQHYLLIETRHRLIVHHRRAAADEIATRFVPGSRLRLDPPGIDLEVAAIYAGTDIA